MGFNEYSKEMRSTDRKLWLGELCWYSVPEAARVDNETLKQALTSVGLEAFMPKAPADHDIFRRVCSANERKRVHTDEHLVYENFLIRSVSQKNRRVVRQVVVERRNENNERLGYSPQVQVEFDKGHIKHSILLSDEQTEAARGVVRRKKYTDHAGISIVPTHFTETEWMANHDGSYGTVVHTEDNHLVYERTEKNWFGVENKIRTIVSLEACRPEAISIAEAIRTDFHTERKTFNSYILRSLIRRVLDGSRATTVRAGVYFVMAENAGRVNSLEVLQGTLPFEVHTLPLLDSDKQRQMLRNAFEAETVGEIDKIMAEMDTLDTLTTERYAGYVTMMKELKAKTGDYSSLLEQALGEADIRLSILDAKVRKLLDKVEA